MKVVRVIPIARGINKEELTYFTTKEVSPGDIATIPLRRREVPALVTGVEKAENHKAQLKRADYTTRKIIDVHENPALSKVFIESSEDAADYFATTTGSILNALVPRDILDSVPTLRPGVDKKVSSRQTSLIESPFHSRVKYYRKNISMTLDSGFSVICITPTITQVQNLTKALEDFDGYSVHTFHGGLTKKTAIKTWKAIASSKKPCVVVGVSSALSIPRKDIGLIVIEDESSRYFKQMVRPYLDGRQMARILSEKTQCCLILGASLLRAETKYKAAHKKDTVTIDHLLASEGAEISIVDIKKNGEGPGEIRLISDELLGLMEKATSRGENMFVFAGRRGLAPTTICSDCGKTVLCKKCLSPVVLHSEKPNNIYICHKCGNTESTKVYCTHCNSWNLKPLGLGIERFEQEITFATFNTKVFRVDRDSTETPVKAQKQVDLWRNSPGSVLLGTEMALPFLETVKYSAIGSIDSFFSLPDFTAGERIYRTINEILEKTEDELLIQSRNVEQPTLKYIESRNYDGFYESELGERRKYSQPPFSTFIKLSIPGSRDSVLKLAEEVKQTLGSYKPVVYSPTTPIVKGKYVINALIEIPEGDWIDKSLLRLLRSLPQSISVDVDSVSLF